MSKKYITNPYKNIKFELISIWKRELPFLIKLELYLLNFKITEFLGRKLRYYNMYKRIKKCRTTYTFLPEFIEKCFEKERQSRANIIVKYK